MLISNFDLPYVIKGDDTKYEIFALRSPLIKGKPKPCSHLGNQTFFTKKLFIIMIYDLNNNVNQTEARLFLH